MREDLEIGLAGQRDHAKNKSRESSGDDHRNSLRKKNPFIHPLLFPGHHFITRTKYTVVDTHTWYKICENRRVQNQAGFNTD